MIFGNNWRTKSVSKKTWSNCPQIRFAMRRCSAKWFDGKQKRSLRWKSHLAWRRFPPLLVLKSIKHSLRVLYLLTLTPLALQGLKPYYRLCHSLLLTAIPDPPRDVASWGVHWFPLNLFQNHPNITTSRVPSPSIWGICRAFSLRP